MLNDAILIDSLNLVKQIKKNKEKYKNTIICTVYTTIYLECKKNKIDCIDLNNFIENDYIKRVF